MDFLGSMCSSDMCREVMVYGWDHCKYDEVRRQLNTECKVFYWNNYTEEEMLEGRIMEQVPKILDKGSEEWCKAGITSVVLENCKRKIEGKSLIPIIFCYDIIGNPYPTCPENIATKDEDENCRYTHSELRRIYKLCNEFTGKNTEISEVACKTIKFVRVEIGDDGWVELKEIRPFWEASNWEQIWEKRQTASVKKPRKENDWRNELVSRWQSYKERGVGVG